MVWLAVTLAEQLRDRRCDRDGRDSVCLVDLPQTPVTSISVHRRCELFPIVPLSPGGPNDPPGSQRRLVVFQDAGPRSVSWMVRGACRGAVGKNCLSYALRTMPHGIWGGTTREERIAMRVPPAVHSQVPAEE